VAWVLAVEALGARSLSAAPWLADLELVAIGPAVVLMVLCISAVSPPTWLRRPMLVLAAIVGAYVVATSLGGCSVGLPLWRLDSARTGDEVLQSAWWSCGPAAAAAVLRERGVAASEADAAVWCGTRPFGGTWALGLAAGLCRGGVPSRPRYFARWDDLVAAPKPCLACTRVFQRVFHVVAVLDVTTSEIEVMDPMMGQIQLSREEFEQQWTHELVVPTDERTRSQ
jgi:hypothetical protein